MLDNFSKPVITFSSCLSFGRFWTNLKPISLKAYDSEMLSTIASIEVHKKDLVFCSLKNLKRSFRKMIKSLSDFILNFFSFELNSFCMYPFTCFCFREVKKSPFFITSQGIPFSFLINPPLNLKPKDEEVLLRSIFSITLILSSP